VLALVAGSMVAPASAPSAHAAPPRPALEYLMEETEGGIVVDSSGNGLDGTITGDSEPTTGPDGSAALELQGGHVDLPAQVLGDSADVTVQMDVKWSGDERPWQWLFALGSGTDEYLFATPRHGEGAFRTAVTAAGGGGEATITGRQALPAERWVNVTVVLDSAEGRLTTYLDGVALSSTTTTVTAADLVAGDGTRSGMIGASFYDDPAFRGAVDGFRIYHEALGAEQVASTIQGELPEFTGLQQTRFDVSTTIGEQPGLPQSAPGDFSDGIVRDIPVEWEDIDPALLTEAGTHTIAGTAGDVAVEALLTVRRGELRVDLSTDTGEVKGGASGLLYGLYGEDMPTANLVEGMNVRTVATKAQDGAQHPGSDALEVLPTLAAADGDVYLRITDFYRGFPYEWPGETPEEKLEDYRQVLADQLEMIDDLPAEQRAHLVIEPFNEPEGNMFGTGQWSLDGVSWLDDPTDYFAFWDETYRTIKAHDPELRVAGPGTSVLFDQVQGFMAHTVEAGTVPDIITWHELTHPQAIRDSVEKYRGWEAEAFTGTDLEGTELPININEYAFNYHTSVPGQMIQWISAIEETKVDAMIAFWNINGNLSDSAVQVNRGNGQWWLYNAYATMSGHTVEVTAPSPGENYTLQGLASLDEEASTARVLLGGADGTVPVDLVGIPREIFGDSARLQLREIAWTGQLGDSAAPRTLVDTVLPVDEDDAILFDLGAGDFPELDDSSAYEIIVTPGDGAGSRAVETPWTASYEAEDAKYEGSGYSKNGPEGTPTDVSKYYTSGDYNVGGLRTGSDGTLTFDVSVPVDGTYDLSVFANSHNTADIVAEQGPTNIFVTVDGDQEQELHLPLAYNWVVWDHADTTVELTEGTHTIRLAANSLDGTGQTQGDALIDRITLTAPHGDTDRYEAENSAHEGSLVPGTPGSVSLDADETATFWVYGETDGEATLEVDGTVGGPVDVNGETLSGLGESPAAAVHLEGGINKVEIHGPATVDAIEIGAGTGQLERTEYQAEDAQLSGDAQTAELSLAEGGAAVTGIGGDPGNDNAATFTVEARHSGRHAVVVRFSNPEQAPASHYNPNPMARPALLSVNDQDPQSVLFVPTFHENNFWERTLYVDLEEGTNTLRFGAEEPTNHSGDGLISDIWPDYPWLRSGQGPILDRISVAEISAPLGQEGTPPEGGDPDDGDSEDGGAPDGGGAPGDDGTPEDEGSADDGTTTPGGDTGSAQPPAENGNDDGRGAGDGSPHPASGEPSADDADAQRHGSLARTGVSALALLLTAAGLIAGGVALRRRGAHG
jgi:hypothetical protein